MAEMHRDVTQAGPAGGVDEDGWRAAAAMSGGNVNT